MNLFKTKKGQIENYFVPVIVLFVFAISFIVAMVILTNFSVGLASAGFCPVGSQCDVAASGFITALSTYDNIILLVAVVLIIAVGLTSFKLPASAAFFIISFIMAPFLGMISFFFNFVFSQIVSQTAFNAVRFYFPKTIFLCTNFHWIALIAFIVGSITLYGKKDRGAGIVE